MTKAPNLLLSTLLQKCPRCRTGRLFKAGNYNLKRFTDMHDGCPHCGQQFQLEPSFFYGAMYVSYALQVALIATVAVALNVLHPEAGLYWYIGGVVFSIIVLFPWVFRMSRSIWIHFFVKFDPAVSQEQDRPSASA